MEGVRDRQVLTLPSIAIPAMVENYTDPIPGAAITQLELDDDAGLSGAERTQKAERVVRHAISCLRNRPTGLHSLIVRNSLDGWMNPWRTQSRAEVAAEDQAPGPEGTSDRQPRAELLFNARRRYNSDSVSPPSINRPAPGKAAEPTQETHTPTSPQTSPDSKRKSTASKTPSSSKRPRRSAGSQSAIGQRGDRRGKNPSKTNTRKQYRSRDVTASCDPVGTGKRLSKARLDAEFNIGFEDPYAASDEEFTVRPNERVISWCHDHSLASVTCDLEQEADSIPNVLTPMSTRSRTIRTPAQGKEVCSRLAREASPTDAFNPFSAVDWKSPQLPTPNTQERSTDTRGFGPRNRLRKPVKDVTMALRASKHSADKSTEIGINGSAHAAERSLILAEDFSVEGDDATSQESQSSGNERRVSGRTRKPTWKFLESGNTFSFRRTL